MIDANGTRNDVSDDRTALHHVHYDPASDRTPSEVLVLGVADFLDADPLALEPLYDTVSPDTVDEFVETGSGSDVGGHLSFTYEDCDVTAHASGLFELEPLD